MLSDLTATLLVQMTLCWIETDSMGLVRCWAVQRQGRVALGTIRTQHGIIGVWKTPPLLVGRWLVTARRIACAVSNTTAFMHQQGLRTLQSGNSRRNTYYRERIGQV